MSEMTTKEILSTLYQNADIVWSETRRDFNVGVNVEYDHIGYRIYESDKKVLEEVERRLGLAEIKGNQGKFPLIKEEK